MAYKNKNYEREYKKGYNPVYWQQNKDKYRDRILTQLGNPLQDEEILRALKSKRKYRSLPDSAFVYGNQVDEYRDQDDW